MSKDVLISKPTNHYHKHFLKSWWLKLHPDAPERISKLPLRRQNAICTWLLMRAKVGKLAHLKSVDHLAELSEFLNVSKQTVKAYLDLLVEMGLVVVEQRQGYSVIRLCSMETLDELLSIKKVVRTSKGKERALNLRISVNLCKLDQLSVKELRLLLVRLIIERSFEKQQYTVIKKLTEDAVVKQIGDAHDISILRQTVSKATFKKVWKSKLKEVRTKVQDGYLERCCKAFDPFAENTLFNPNITNSRKGLARLMGRSAMTASSAIRKLVDTGLLKGDRPHFSFLKGGSYQEFVKLRSVMHHYWLTWSNERIFIRFANDLVLN